MISRLKCPTSVWLEQPWMRKADTYQHVSWELLGKKPFSSIGFNFGRSLLLCVPTWPIICLCTSEHSLYLIHLMTLHLDLCILVGNSFSRKEMEATHYYPKEMYILWESVFNKKKIALWKLIYAAGFIWWSTQLGNPYLFSYLKGYYKHKTRKYFPCLSS